MPRVRSRDRATLSRLPRTADGTVARSSILDHGSTGTTECVASIEHGDRSEPLLVQAAHRLITARITTVYALDDRQPALVSRGRGSCSLLLAVLAAVARARSIATRVRGLFVGRSFWYPRHRRLPLLVPRIVVLAWHEFLLDDDRVGASELFAPLVATPVGTAGCTNADGETLFDAASQTLSRRVLLLADPIMRRGRAVGVVVQA